MASIREVAPYVDMCPMTLFTFHNRNEPTMYQLQLRTRAIIHRYGTSLHHLSVEEICCKSSALGILSEGVLSKNPNFHSASSQLINVDTRRRTQPTMAVSEEDRIMHEE